MTSNAFAKPKKNIFMYTNNMKMRSAAQENAPFAVSPLLNIDTEDNTTPSVKNTRKIGKMPFKVLDAP